VQDRKQSQKEPRDSVLSESEQAALDYAKAKHEEHKHRAWLWGIIKGVSKWAAVVAGGVLVTLNVVKSVLSAIRDGL
jgi:hypothetical protein